eukprot:3610077-Pleurochrysis_carterae.AAC.1
MSGSSRSATVRLRVSRTDEIANASVVRVCSGVSSGIVSRLMLVSFSMAWSGQSPYCSSEGSDSSQSSQ